MSKYSCRISYLPEVQDCFRRGIVKSNPHIFKEAGFKLTPSRQKGVAGAVGTGVHSGVSYSLEQKRDTGEPASLQKSVDKGMASFDDEIRTGVEFDTISPNVNSSHKQIIRITKAYKAFIEPNIKPIEIEKSYKAILKDTKFTGHLDQLESNAIRDLKTGRSVHNYWVQQGGYSILAEANGITGVEYNIIDHLPRTDLKKEYPLPKIYTISAEYAKKLAQNIMNRVNNALNLFEKTGDIEIFPVNPASILCSAKYCPAHGTDACKITKGG